MIYYMEIWLLSIFTIIDNNALKRIKIVNEKVTMEVKANAQFQDSV